MVGAWFSAQSLTALALALVSGDTVIARAEEEGHTTHGELGQEGGDSVKTKGRRQGQAANAGGEKGWIPW